MLRAVSPTRKYGFESYLDLLIVAAPTMSQVRSTSLNDTTIQLSGPAPDGQEARPQKKWDKAGIYLILIDDQVGEWRHDCQEDEERTLENRGNLSKILIFQDTITCKTKRPKNPPMMKERTVI